MSLQRASGPALSESSENYLKAIFEFGADGKRVTTSKLAEHLDVAPASVTGMLKKLATDRPALIDYRPRQGARLTPVGRRIAVEVIRHHRLIELYLHEALGFGRDEVHDEAERLEHVISEAFEDRMAEFLGDPEYDPHGAPIPRKDGSIPEQRGHAIEELAPGVQAVIVRVPDRDGARSRRLEALGIAPGRRLRCQARSASDRMLRIELRDGARWVGHELERESLRGVRVEADEA